MKCWPPVHGDLAHRRGRSSYFPSLLTSLLSYSWSIEILFCWPDALLPISRTCCCVWMSIRQFENVINACLQEAIFLNTITVKAEMRPLLMKIIPWLRRSLPLYTRFKYSPCNTIGWEKSDHVVLFACQRCWFPGSILGYAIKTVFFKLLIPLKLLAEFHIIGHGILFNFLGGFLLALRVVPAHHD